MKVIARMHSDLSGKFGIPRQSGLVGELRGTIVFEPEYRVPEALRGLEGFDYIWLIWKFSLSERSSWSPTVRPPRLGGNKRVGVFATRSPFRPNPVGLSCVRLLGIETRFSDGPVLVVGGADLADGTPIFDIKPYVPYADARPGARGGFASVPPGIPLRVKLPDEIGRLFTPDRRDALAGVLSRDPRPRYHDDPERIYSMTFAGYDVKFRVDGDRLLVCGAERLKGGEAAKTGMPVAARRTCK